MTSYFTPKSQLNIKPLPLPTPPSETPVYPQNMNDYDVVSLTQLYTQYNAIYSYAVLQLAMVEAKSIEVRDEMEKEITLRFVHSDSKSTTERKERAKASKKVIGLQSNLSLLNQDLVVLRALVDGYKTSLFSIKHELERRTRYE